MKYLELVAFLNRYKTVCSKSIPDSILGQPHCPAKYVTFQRGEQAPARELFEYTLPFPMVIVWPQQLFQTIFP